VEQVFDQLITRVETLPIVSSAGAVLLRPLSGPVGWDVQPTLPGEPPRDEGTWSLTPHTNLQIVTPGYFRTMGIRLLRGRLFDAGDRRDTAGVVVVGESAARRLWPGKDPLGQQLRAAYIPHDPKGPPEWQTVIGVVADVRYRGLRDVRLDLYVPNTQSTMHPQHLMVRTRGMPADVVASVRSIAQSLDPGATVSEAELMTDVVAAESAPWRFLMRVFVAFAVLGATLAAVGLAAVVALAVATRRRELSIRAALGADGRRLRTLVAGEALWLVAVGSGVGIVAAVALARSAASVLIGVAPHDVWAILGATSIAAVVGLCACWLPARRAADANPIEALRTE
jgi:putative ABC transport system permease protein